MGLVEADPEDSTKHHSVDVEGVKIFWDDAIEEIRSGYGRIFIDAFHSFMGNRFYVAFEGSRC